MMKIHFIAIGGSAMHNLAIALHKQGHTVTGSDDEIFEPSKGRLNKYGLLPNSIGWDETKITTDLDVVILGMHARKTNPELIKAQQLGLKIFSYPEYIYEATKNKKRVVIGGSHGKTTITSMILHVCGKLGIEVDYMVGAQLEGFEVMVKLSNEAEYAILEGDEYLSSPIDRRPKFHLYQPNIALLSGIAWDHINVFPTFDNYVDQFRQFIKLTEKQGSLIYCSADNELNNLVKEFNEEIELIPYNTLDHQVENGRTTILENKKEYIIEVFGKHNLQNMNGARHVCNQIGIADEDFFQAIKSFKGASKRLELLQENDQTVIYKDYAHSPSKLKATTQALKEQYPNRELIACMELHTFSSLNQKFLNQYDGTMKNADKAFVYFSPKAIAHKKLDMLSEEDVLRSFNSKNVTVFTDSNVLIKALKEINFKNRNLLLMSSGNFDGVNLNELAKELINQPLKVN